MWRSQYALKMAMFYAPPPPLSLDQDTNHYSPILFYSFISGLMSNVFIHLALILYMLQQFFFIVLSALFRSKYSNVIMIFQFSIFILFWLCMSPLLQCKKWLFKLDHVLYISSNDAPQDVEYWNIWLPWARGNDYLVGFWQNSCKRWLSCESLTRRMAIL